jgi:glutamate dehydrogenase/leucine dehydrogenase
MTTWSSDHDELCRAPVKRSFTFTSLASTSKAIVAVDNTAAGPAIGGTRMALTSGVEECVRLARAMT